MIETPTQDSYIDTVIMRGDCMHHAVPKGMACYTLPALRGSRDHVGVCNSRAKKAGFNGRITPTHAYTKKDNR